MTPAATATASTAKGASTRGMLLERACGMAARVGLEGLTIGELASALEQSGITVVAAGRDGLRADAHADQVGRVALAAGVPLTELRAADGAGLEEMFLELTAETSREGAAA